MGLRRRVRDTTSRSLVLLWFTGVVAIPGLIAVTLPVWRRLGPDYGYGTLRGDLVSWARAWRDPALVVVLIPLALWLAAFFAGQEHTYTPVAQGGSPIRRGLRAVGVGAGWSLFLGVTSILTWLFVGVPVALIYTAVAAVGAMRPAGSADVLMAGLVASAGAVAAWFALLGLYRAAWLRAALGQLENLSTSRVASAAVGLVELSGVVQHLAGGEPHEPIYGMNPLAGSTSYAPRAFTLEDETGRVRVEPPRSADSLSPHFAPRRDPHHGQLALMPGERAHVIGFLDVDPEAPVDATGTGRLVVRPWRAPWGSGLPKLLDALGVRRWLGAFAEPSLFVVAAGDQAESRRHLSRELWFWLPISALLLIGSLTVASTGVASLAGRPLFRVFKPPLLPSVALQDGDGRVSSPIPIEENLAPREVAVPLLLDRLAAHDADHRRRAAFLLSGYAPEATEAIPALAARLGDRGEGVAEHAARTLPLFGAAAAPVLREGLASGDRQVQQWSGRALVVAAPDPASRLDLVREMLGSPRAGVREVGAEAAAALGEPGRALYGELVTRLEDADPAVRLAAVEALAGLAGDAPPQIEPRLLASLMGEDAPRARRAAGDLVLRGALSDAERLALLAALLEQGTEQARLQAIRVAGGLGGGVRALVPALAGIAGTGGEAGGAAIEALGAIGAVDELVALLAHDDPETRSWAAWELRGLRVPASALPVLARGVRDSVSRVREVSLEALAELARDEATRDLALEPVIAALGDPSPETREDAREALLAAPVLNGPAVAILAAELRDADVWQADAILRALEGQGETAAAGLEGQGETAAAGLEGVIASLERSELRERAIRTLGVMRGGASGALPRLRAIAADGSVPGETRMAAAKAVLMIETPSRPARSQGPPLLRLDSGGRLDGTLFSSHALVAGTEEGLLRIEGPPLDLPSFTLSARFRVPEDRPLQTVQFLASDGFAIELRGATLWAVFHDAADHAKTSLRLSNGLRAREGSYELLIVRAAHERRLRLVFDGEESRLDDYVASDPGGAVPFYSRLGFFELRSAWELEELVLWDYARPTP